MVNDNKFFGLFAHRESYSFVYAFLLFELCQVLH